MVAKRIPARLPLISALRWLALPRPSRSPWRSAPRSALPWAASALADRLGDPWLVLLLNLPALVIIVLAYIWAGLTETAAIAAVALNKLPDATVTVREGARSLDRQS